MFEFMYYFTNTYSGGGDMSASNQSRMRRSVQKSQGYADPNSRAADYISGVFFVALNAIAILGEFTNIFSKYGRGQKGILFLYDTVCAPVAAFFSKFYSLGGSSAIYNWIAAQTVFFATSFLVWVLIFIVVRIFKR